MTTIVRSAPPPALRQARAPSRRRTYTPDQFLALESTVGYEYELDADGHLEARNLGAESDEVAAAIIGLLRLYAPGRGHVFGAGSGLKIFPDRPNRVPRGDAIYLSRERLPRSPRGHLTVAPELVVEVVSPGDTAADLDSKVAEYLSAGVLLVLVVYPDTRSVLVRRADGSADVYGIGDEISGEEALPGFSAKVADFFPE